MKYPKRSQYKYAKSRYRIRNWPEYEAGLRNRGDLTVWLSDAAVYEAVQGKGRGNRVRVLIPPGRGAQPSSSRLAGQRERNRNIRSMRKLGRKEWYTSSGYSRRSLVENAVFRYKSLLGQRMRSRSLENQRVEVRLACKILNTMTSLGMPDSVKVG